MNIPEWFPSNFEKLKANLPEQFHLSAASVFQQGVPENKEIIGKMMERLMLEGSGIRGAENLKALYEYSQRGESCLILIEHYSNFDFTCLYRSIENEPQLGPAVARSLLPVQGLKLATGNSVTPLFSRSYDTLIIYPSRSLSEIDPDDHEAHKILAMARPINIAAMMKMTQMKNEGRIITVFAAGTRYRPWKPETKTVVREVFTYLKAFKHVVFIGINGNLLPPHPSEQMENDEPQEDVILFTVSELFKGKEYRRQKMAETPEGEDPGYHVAKAVKEDLDKIHESSRPVYLEAFKELGREPATDH